MTNQHETPEGWERRGPCLIREHGGKLAVIDPHPSHDSWWGRVYVRGLDEGNTDNFRPLPDAVAWANEQLGVPKPVEVVRTEYSDAWILTCEQTGRSWRVSKDVRCRDYADIERAMSEGDAYVRGDA